MGAREKAEKYERLYPGATSDDSQKVERMERMDFKDEVYSLRRTNRNRGIVVPAVPWIGGDE